MTIMINLICLTNKYGKYVICNNWVCFYNPQNQKFKF